MNMTQLLYLDDSYLKEIKANVIECKDNKVILDKTIFYPTGGGQPHDTGHIDDRKVIDVYKDGENVIHVIEGQPVQGEVLAKIDWNRRYRLMRMHTAAHVLAGGVMYGKYGAKITGNQLDVDVSRFDFNIENFNRELLEKAVELANNILMEGRNVKTYYIDKEEAKSRPDLVKLYKSDILDRLEKIRIVEIEGIDIQADGGTHVKNLKEVGKIEIVKMENKGKSNRRVYFTLKDF